jgi:hypothetical protein
VIVAAETGRTASAKPVASVVVAVAATVLMTVRRVTGLGLANVCLDSGAGVGVGIGELGSGALGERPACKIPTQKARPQHAAVLVSPLPAQPHTCHPFGHSCGPTRNGEANNVLRRHSPGSCKVAGCRFAVSSPVIFEGLGLGLEAVPKQFSPPAIYSSQ